MFETRKEYHRLLDVFFSLIDLAGQGTGTESYGEKDNDLYWHCIYTTCEFQMFKKE